MRRCIGEERRRYEDKEREEILRLGHRSIQRRGRLMENSRNVVMICLGS